MLGSSTYVAFTRVEPFVGRHNRSEDSLRWFKTFVYEMEGTRTLPNEWCLPFELSLHDGAMYWFLQLPRKTRRNWKLLSHEFLRYYCTPYTQSPVVRYYSATCGRKEHICDYLNRLSGYALNEHLLIVEGERDAKLHVDQFLLTCGDDRMMGDLGWLGLSDIRQVEEVIDYTLKCEERTIARSAIRQPRYECNSFQRSDTWSRSEGRDGYGHEIHRDRHGCESNTERSKLHQGAWRERVEANEWSSITAATKTTFWMTMDAEVLLQTRMMVACRLK
ncbi:hypothetical protein PC116_g27127 [Phytophthora cactorum]|nr:hypothetical protein Pcac1_g24278 [Phytophthora cactorum]KAG2965621.1 hypothetical protein PC119_g24952 [Phytophthora cactorum]KAG4224419.1 hypothetical protein PC116_g27127 [Phytophthora cactorum]